METKDKLKKNLPMSAKTGEFRQQVLDIIHTAKYEYGMKLPMVKYRLVEDESYVHTAMGVGGAPKGKPEIRISEKYFNTDAFVPLVLHELAHACWGQQHVEGCPLMGPTYKGIKEAEAWELFDLYYKQHLIEKEFEYENQVRQ